MSRNFKKVIAIDGPAGSGKSTVAERLADELSTLYIDTGAMYRAVTFKALNENIDFDDKKSIEKLVDDIDISLEKTEQGLKVLLNGNDVTKKLRSSKVNKNISRIAKNKIVRKKMVQMQRQFGAKGAIVEGRDIGTVVFKKAYKKFYLDAHLDERIKRRLKQAKSKGRRVDEKTIKEEVINRDRSDRSRKIGPLRISPDSIYIDTTNLSIDEVVNKILNFIKNE